jgi:hypothetical protein
MITIKHRFTGEVLFRGGEFATIAEALQAAIASRANLRGAYLRGAYLSGADMSGAYLSGADMSGADLRGADLRGADLRGADMSDALNIICLPVGDPRGYRPVAVWFGDHWVIYSGCRRFTIAEAREHWGDAYKGERSTSDQYIAACNWLEKQPAPEAADRKVEA